MTDDLVTRLQLLATCTDYHRAELEEAADRIEELEAALRKIAKHDMQSIAMDALRPGERIKEKK